MATLRLTQTAGKGPDKYRVEMALSGDGAVPQNATAEFEFRFTDQDREDLRWYLEDYLEHAADPAPKIAARVEQRMTEVGSELFEKVLGSTTVARLWARLQPMLSDTRIEIAARVQEATAIPWELLCDPLTQTPLALEAQSLVRVQSDQARVPKVAKPAKGGKAGKAIRILLVICRPGGDKDVPFRSVASRLIKGLSESARTAFDLQVLRPPSFEQLAKTLRAAKADGRPYHVVHFDGHGTYEDTSQPGFLASLLKGLGPLMLSTPRSGSHGYLLFENPAVDGNAQFVDGPALGNLLAETGVPVLVLNACRSAHAESPPAPDSASETDTAGTEPDTPASPVVRRTFSTAADDFNRGDAGGSAHALARSLGSLAQEVVDAGAAGVVAMRYNVYVVTAAQFVADLYGALARGHSLGEAVTLGRKQLHDQPLREIAYEPRALQDWPVPVVYEAAPVALFPKPAWQSADGLAAVKINLSAGAPAPDIGGGLPPAPDSGFYGRDETLLALDRAFDRQQIVLLHAYAGSGKTTTAAEFARWYALTGGLKGPVLFTSFEQYRPLCRVLDAFGQVFGPILENAGVNWQAIVDEDKRRNIALQVFRQVPALWIWDNVEPIAGFPAGAASAWSNAEQLELVNFLRAARDTQAKFLLTSRRDERDWLGDLPARISVPAMPMQERVQLARALAEKHSRRLTDVEDWRPLLRFTQGNPLTITVLVGQALRDGLRSAAQIADFVARLSRGEAAFSDEAAEGRSKSLGASLSYGFEHAFGEAERKQLALLHFFQGFVDVKALQLMGHTGADWCLPELQGLTRESGIALLNRGAEVGLLTAHGGGYYSIHPALPWFFKSLFEQYYPSSLERAARAYVGAIGALGDYYHRQFNEGNRDVINALAAEEANLLHARQLARTHGWWYGVMSAMQGLHMLYDLTGRRAEWARLVNEIVPDFVDPDTDGPLPGREEDWSLVTEYRVRLAQEARQWLEAERLQRVCVEWVRKRTESVLALPMEALNASQRNEIRTLAASLHELGQIYRELGQADCILSYEEALSVSERIDDRPGTATCAFNLGHAYKDITALRDLDKAEHWYRRSLELRDESDAQGRAQCLSQLGSVAWERFKEAKAANRPHAEQLGHLNAAAQWYHQALDLDPTNAVNDLAVDHNQLGMIYGDAGDFDRALTHYREAIRNFEAGGDIYRAAGTRRNVAIHLAKAGRLADAREYALAALRNYETYGDRAADRVQEARGLIAWIDALIAKASGS